MGLYSRYLFPRLMDRAFAQAGVAPLRQEALSAARGRVLDIGFGTGLNLQAFPPEVARLVVVDRQAPVLRFVQERLKQSPVPVEFCPADASNLPFDAASFDSVVTTWTLCSVDQVEASLREIRRVLRPGGRYLFLEHGLSPEPRIQRIQHRIAPITRLFADGCRPNRPISSLIQAAGFRIERLREIDEPGLGTASGHLFLGAASGD